MNQRIVGEDSFERAAVFFIRQSLVPFVLRILATNFNQIFWRTIRTRYLWIRKSNERLVP